jgi:hypothetical protein
MASALVTAVSVGPRRHGRWWPVVADRGRSLHDDGSLCCFDWPHLGVTNALTLLSLLRMSDRAKDSEILALRHQIAVLERQQHGDKVRS